MKLGDRLSHSDAVVAWSLTVVRILIGALFVYSGLSKLIQPIEYFEVAVAQYSLIPQTLLPLLASILPWIELTAGTFLLLGRRINKAAGTLVVLTFIFQLALSQAIWRRLPMDECGCFGGSVHLTLFQSFTLDSVVLLILIQLAFADKSRLSLDGSRFHAPEK